MSIQKKSRQFAEKRGSTGESGVGESARAWDRALTRSWQELRPAGGDAMEWIGDVAPFEPGRDALGPLGDPFEEGDRLHPARTTTARRQHQDRETIKLWTAVIAGALVGSLLGFIGAGPQRRERKLQK
jgi:hypothetical protein